MFIADSMLSKKCVKIIIRKYYTHVCLPAGAPGLRHRLSALNV